MLPSRRISLSLAGALVAVTGLAAVSPPARQRPAAPASSATARAVTAAEAFLASDSIRSTSCLILDVGMPGMTGPDLQRELARRGQSIPIIFITAQKDDTVRPRLLERGAVECLFKPFSDAALQKALSSVVQMD